MKEYTKHCIYDLLNSSMKRIGVISPTPIYDFVDGINKEFNIKILLFSPPIDPNLEGVEIINKKVLDLKKKINQYDLLVVKDSYDIPPTNFNEMKTREQDIYVHKLLDCLKIKQIDYVEKTKQPPNAKVIDMEYKDLALVDVICIE